jgi:hypothetical protein
MAYYVTWRSTNPVGQGQDLKKHLIFYCHFGQILGRRRSTVSVCEHNLLIDFRLE